MPVGLDISNARNRWWREPGIEATLGRIVGDANLNFARVMAPWYNIERSRDVYAPDGLSLLDKDYVETIRNGARPLIQLFTSPKWAVGYTDPLGARDSGCPDGGNFCKQAPSSANYPELAEFAADIASRYPLAAGIEVWNEPNLWQFWHAERVDPAAYTELLRQTSAAIKQADPAMRVFGGVFNANDIDGSTAAMRQHCGTREHNLLAREDCLSKADMSGATFFRGMLAAGADQYLDGVSIHAKAVKRDSNHPNRPELFAYQYLYDQMEAVWSQERPDSLPSFRILQSESGANVDANILGPADGFFSEPEQSSWVLEQYRLVSSPEPGELLDYPGVDRTDGILFFESLDVARHGWFTAQQDLFGNLVIDARPVYCDIGILLGGQPQNQPGC